MNGYLKLRGEDKDLGRRGEGGGEDNNLRGLIIYYLLSDLVKQHWDCEPPLIRRLHL
jgi:hypothetical protein